MYGWTPASARTEGSSSHRWSIQPQGCLHRLTSRSFDWVGRGDAGGGADPLRVPEARRSSRDDGLGVQCRCGGDLAASFREGTDNAPCRGPFRGLRPRVGTSRRPNRLPAQSRTYPTYISGASPLSARTAASCTACRRSRRTDSRDGGTAWAAPGSHRLHAHLTSPRDGKLIALQLHNKDYADPSVIGTCQRAHRQDGQAAARPHRRAGRALAFSPDGTLLGSVSHDGGGDRLGPRRRFTVVDGAETATPAASTVWRSAPTGGRCTPCGDTGTPRVGPRG